MKFRFIGDPRDGFSGPDAITLRGVTFPRGEAVEVPDALLGKLTGHSHFEVVAETVEAPAPKRGRARRGGVDQD